MAEETKIPKNLQEEIEKIPFPESLTKDKKIEDILRNNWSGDPEKFIANIENSLGIKTTVDLSDKDNPRLFVTKRTSE